MCTLSIPRSSRRRLALKEFLFVLLMDIHLKSYRWIIFICRIVRKATFFPLILSLLMSFIFVFSRISNRMYSQLSHRCGVLQQGRNTTWNLLEVKNEGRGGELFFRRQEFSKWQNPNFFSSPLFLPQPPSPKTPINRPSIWPKWSFSPISSNTSFTESNPCSLFLPRLHPS